MGQLVYLKDVVTLELAQEKCKGCGMCLLVCPQAVLSKANGTAEIANRDACMECGACARNCPVEALRVSAGVGCAAALINSMLRRKNSNCCCTIDPEKSSSDSSETSQGPAATGCC